MYVLCDCVELYTGYCCSVCMVVCTAVERSFCLSSYILIHRNLHAARTPRDATAHTHTPVQLYGREPDTSDTSVFCLKWDITMCMCAHCPCVRVCESCPCPCPCPCIHICEMCSFLATRKGQGEHFRPTARPSARPSDRRLSRLCQHRVRRIGVALGVAVLYL